MISLVFHCIIDVPDQEISCCCSVQHFWKIFKIHSMCCYTRWNNRNCCLIQKSKSSCISKKTHQNVLNKRRITSNQHSCSKPSLKSKVLIRKLWRLCSMKMMDCQAKFEKGISRLKDLKTSLPILRSVMQVIQEI